MTEFSFERIGKTGKTKITVTEPDGRVHVFTANILEDASRGEVLDRISERFPGLERQGIEQLLEQEAARPAACAESIAERWLAQLRQSGRIELFHGADREPYAFVRVDTGHEGVSPAWETMRMRGRSFQLWLGCESFRALGKVPNKEVMTALSGALSGEAMFASPERAVFVRVAEHRGDQGDEVWLDLANEAHELVRITSTGWSIVPAREAPVRFVRPRGLLALPTPERGGSISELREFVNVDDEHWPLLVGFLLMALRPRGPYPILLVNGEQGSAKSTAARLLRSLVDPNEADNRRPPKDPQSLSIAARNAWLLSYDNLSAIPPWLADDLCALVTGAGFATRELFSDGEEVIFRGARPVILNGIPDLGDRPDLADRGVHFMLQRIDESKRREEAELNQAFESVRPRLLGALLSAVAHALAHEAGVKLVRKPRLADFARWVEAGAPALGLKAGEFIERYFRNRREASSNTLELNAFGAAVRDFVELEGSWTGSLSDLLSAVTSEERAHSDGWPSSIQKATSELRRIAPCLRACGINVETGVRDTDRRRTVYRLWKSPATTSTTSISSIPSPAAGGAEPPRPREREVVEVVEVVADGSAGENSVLTNTWPLGATRSFGGDGSHDPGQASSRPAAQVTALLIDADRNEWEDPG